MKIQPGGSKIERERALDGRENQLLVDRDLVLNENSTPDGTKIKRRRKSIIGLPLEPSPGKLR